jgi:hypothetical protein
VPEAGYPTPIPVPEGGGEELRESSYAQNMLFEKMRLFPFPIQALLYMREIFHSFPRF